MSALTLPLVHRAHAELLLANTGRSSCLEPVRSTGYGNVRININISDQRYHRRGQGYSGHVSHYITIYFNTEHCNSVETPEALATLTITLKYNIFLFYV